MYPVLVHLNYLGCLACPSYLFLTSYMLSEFERTAMNHPFSVSFCFVAQSLDYSREKSAVLIFPDIYQSHGPTSTLTL